MVEDDHYRVNHSIVPLNGDHSGTQHNLLHFQRYLVRKSSSWHNQQSSHYYKRTCNVSKCQFWHNSYSYFICYLLWFTIFVIQPNPKILWCWFHKGHESIILTRAPWFSQNCSHFWTFVLSCIPWSLLCDCLVTFSINYCPSSRTIAGWSWN